MLRKLLQVFVIVLAGFALGAFLTEKLTRVNKIQNSVVQKERTPSVSSDRFRELVKEDRRDFDRGVIKAKFEGDTRLAACYDAFRPLMDIKISKDLKFADLPRNIAPCSLENEMLAKQRAAYADVCRSDKDLPQCLAVFVLLRASANAWIHREDNVSKIEDLKTLADILVGSVGSGDIDRFEAAAVRMRELAPDMYEPLKANIIAKVMRAASLENKSDERDFSDVISLLERDLDEAKRLPQADPELQEAIILAATRMGKERDRMDQIVADLKRSGQSGPTLEYYEISVLWKNGDRETATRRMKALAEKYKTNERFQETLKNLLADSTGSNKNFSSKLSLNFDFLNAEPKP